MTLAPGTRIYRIIDDGSNPGGSYWAFSIPPSEAAWRAGNAVLDNWNSDGQYVEYEVPPGPGLNVWAGGTSGQGLSEDGDPGHVLPGGEQQKSGGSNRVVLRVDDLPAVIEALRGSGATFRNEMEVGPGGRQIQIKDPDGNPIELFEPAAAPR